MTVQLDVPVAVKMVITKKAPGYRLSITEYCSYKWGRASFGCLHKILTPLIYYIVETLHRCNSLSQGSMAEIRKIPNATEKLYITLLH